MISDGEQRERANGVRQKCVIHDGLTVFLFDECFTDLIREENPEVIWSIGEGTFEEPITKALLSKGEMLVYGLRGDGSVDLEVVVGLPLTESELSGSMGPWVYGLWGQAESVD